MVLLLPMGGPPLPTFSDPFISVTVLALTSGSLGIDGLAGLGSGRCRRVVLERLVRVEGKARRQLLRAGQLWPPDRRKPTPANLTLTGRSRWSDYYDELTTAADLNADAWI